MRALICQTNTTPGNFESNVNQIMEGIDKGNSENVDLVVFPELSIPGYLCKDMMFRNGFIEKNKQYLQQILQRRMNHDMYVVVGYVEKNYEGWGKPFRNMAAIIKNGAVVTTYQKQLLPFYDVFDEGRYFQPGKSLTVIDIKGEKWGICICEDLWNDKDMDDYNYQFNPLEEYRTRGIHNIISLNSSPYVVGKQMKRVNMVSKSSYPAGTIIYCNQLGGQDELVFDGNSFVAHRGSVRAWAKEDSYCLYDSEESPKYNSDIMNHSNVVETYKMLSLGLKDYVNKSGFKEVVVGSSGGIDSALVIALACDALGSDRVHGIRMPTKISSGHSKDDAKLLHDNLGCHDHLVPIEHSPMIEHILKNINIERKVDPLADENIQARLRGITLMYFSNAFGALLLSTGNKTELALGYCTLYGDMNGGFCPINDLYKLDVYAMAKYYNANIKNAIPEHILTKAPSAELAPGQTDEVALLPYVILDTIVKGYVEHFIADYQKFITNLPNIEPDASKWMKVADWTKEFVKANTHRPDAETEYYRILKLIDRSEFKRRQSAPGIKLTKVAFGIGRRLPIVKG